MKDSNRRSKRFAYLSDFVGLERGLFHVVVTHPTKVGHGHLRSGNLGEIQRQSG